MLTNAKINTAVDRFRLDFDQNEINRILCKIAQGRKIIILGLNWKAVVFGGRYNIDIAYYAVQDYSEEKYGKTYDNIEIRSVYDIAYEEYGTFYIVNADFFVEWQIAEAFLMGMGLKVLDDFCTICSLEIDKFATDDVNLRYSRQFELPGVKIFGNEEDKNALRIVTLGGSTTDAVVGCAFGASWPQHLFDMLQRSGLPSVIYNCGIAGYTSPREFIKLCRDGLTLAPDLVISYGGVNDLQPDNDFFSNRHKRPWVDNWTEIQARTAQNHINGKILYGLQSEMTNAESWVKHIRMMYGVCNELNIKFAGFFQSFMGTNGEIKEFEIKLQEAFEKFRYNELAFWRALYYDIGNHEYVDIYANSVSEMIKDIPYIFDKRYIYKNNTELLSDYCHTTDAGNHLIAQHIYKELKENGYFDREDKR